MGVPLGGVVLFSAVLWGEVWSAGGIVLSTFGEGLAHYHESYHHMSYHHLFYHHLSYSSFVLPIICSTINMCPTEERLNHLYYYIYLSYQAQLSYLNKVIMHIFFSNYATQVLKCTICSNNSVNQRTCMGSSLGGREVEQCL